MADPRFFQRAAAKTLGQIAVIAGAELAPGVNADLQIEDVAPLDQAGAGQISFFDNVRYKPQFLTTKAAACIVAPAMAEYAPPGVALLLTSQPYQSYALVAQAFYPRPSFGPPRVDGWCDPAAKLGDGVIVERGAQVAAGAEIGARTRIGRNALIGENVVIGTDCDIGPNAVVSHALISNRVRLYPGVCIGQDGFGFAMGPGGFTKVPQLGRVVIEDNVEIGANTTIDRGSGPDTVIGAGTWIDNLVQIGHNVKIGKGCVLVSQVGISGSTVVDDYAIFAGQAGIAGHLHIGKGARIGAKAGVMRDVPAGEEVLGAPAIPVRQFMRQVAAIDRLARGGKKKGSTQK